MYKGDRNTPALLQGQLAEKSNSDQSFQAPSVDHKKENLASLPCNCIHCPQVFMHKTQELVARMHFTCGITYFLF